MEFDEVLDNEHMILYILNGYLFGFNELYVVDKARIAQEVFGHLFVVDKRSKTSNIIELLRLENKESGVGQDGRVIESRFEVLRDEAVHILLGQLGIYCSYLVKVLFCLHKIQQDLHLWSKLNFPLLLMLN